MMTMERVPNQSRLGIFTNLRDTIDRRACGGWYLALHCGAWRLSFYGRTK
jgi:hypothetical protein